MKPLRGLSFLSVLLCALLLTIACQPSGNSPQSKSQAEAVSLTVSAAASLQDAMTEIQSLYVQQQPEVTLTFNFGSSGSLQQQIEQGAPVDVFFSAAAKQMDALQAKNLLLNNTRKDLLTNQLVLVVPEASDLEGFEALTTDRAKVVAIGEPESVPAGKYAQETLTSLGLWQQINPKLVLAKDVRQVLNYVETGNADAGLVYLTDAKTAQGVKVVATAPETSHQSIVYPVAVLKNSQNPEAAREFVQFLETDSARSAFEQYGFTALRN